jgi:Domain of unknown function (DUF4440)
MHYDPRDQVPNMKAPTLRLEKLASTGLLAVALLGIWPQGPAAQEANLIADARRNLSVLFEALRSGDPNQVRPFLAPEFQVVRSNGAAYNKEQYLTHSIPKIKGQISFDDLVATRNADIVVTRMKLKIRERLDGKQAESGAPQLIVFRVTPSGWKVVAAANFAKLLN